jgi:predicted regulator of Ras-like GTPase activity (Roadblock/LC7/MglB family)
MDSVLRDINAIDGVVGSFVCDMDGTVLAAALPNSLGRGPASDCAAFSAAQIVSGLKDANASEVQEVDLHCEKGRLLVKVFGPGCLCIMCNPQVSLPEVNLTANVATRKLARIARRLAKQKGRTVQPRAQQGPGRERRAAQSTESILEKVLDLWR